MLPHPSVCKDIHHTPLTCVPLHNCKKLLQMKPWIDVKVGSLRQPMCRYQEVLRKSQQGERTLLLHHPRRRRLTSMTATRTPITRADCSLRRQDCLQSFRAFLMCFGHRWQFLAPALPATIADLNSIKACVEDQRRLGLKSRKLGDVSSNQQESQIWHYMIFILC